MTPQLGYALALLGIAAATRLTPLWRGPLEARRRAKAAAEPLFPVRLLDAALAPTPGDDAATLATLRDTLGGPDPRGYRRRDEEAFYALSAALAASHDAPPTPASQATLRRAAASLLASGSPPLQIVAARAAAAAGWTELAPVMRRVAGEEGAGERLRREIDAALQGLSAA